MRNQKREGAAKIAAGFIAKEFGIEKDSVQIGLILGTGWGDAINYEEMGVEKEIPFSNIPGFRSLPYVEGQKRNLLLGKISGKPVLMLNGRVHLNEAPSDMETIKMVRLQVEMLIQLGIKKLVATAAVGVLRPINKTEINSHFYEPGACFQLPLEVGDVAVINGFVSVYVNLPLWAGEFCSPEDSISERLNKIALGTDSVLRTKEVGHVMFRGPNFEGRRYDKDLLAASGAEVVGMSLLPEAAIAALYEDVKFLGLGFVTNNDTEVHSHKENLKRAQASSVLLSEYLEKIIAKI